MIASGILEADIALVVVQFDQKIMKLVQQNSVTSSSHLVRGASSKDDRIRSCDSFARLADSLNLSIATI